jgi:hypothetical protein
MKSKYRIKLYENVKIFLTTPAGRVAKAAAWNMAEDL